eukprot:6025420-Amphidinium_carterae.1
MKASVSCNQATCLGQGGTFACSSAESSIALPIAAVTDRTNGNSPLCCEAQKVSHQRKENWKGC